MKSLYFCTDIIKLRIGMFFTKLYSISLLLGIAFSVQTLPVKGNFTDLNIQQVNTTILNIRATTGDLISINIETPQGVFSNF